MTWMRMTNTSSQVPQPQGYFMNPAMYLMLPQPFPAPRTNTQSPQNGEFGPTELRHGISSASCGMMQQHPPFYYQRPIGWPAHHSVYNYNPSTPWSYRKAEDQEQRTQSTNGSNDVIPIQQGRVDPHGSGDTVPLFTEHSSILPSFNTSLPAPRNLPKHQIHGFSFSPHHRVEEEHTYDSGTTISEHQVDRSKASSANDARDILIDDMSQFSNNSSHASAKSSSSSRKVEECSLPLPPFSSPMYRHPSWTPQNLSSSRFSAETQRPMESHPYESDQTQHHMTNVGYLQDRYSYPPFPQSSSTSSTTSTSSSLQDKYENYFAQQEMQHQRQPQQHDLNVSPDNYDQIHFGSHHRDHNQDEIVPSLKKRIKIENVDKTTKEKEKTNSAGQGH